MAKMELVRPGLGGDPGNSKDFTGSAQVVEESNCPSPEKTVEDSHLEIFERFIPSEVGTFIPTLGFCLHFVKGIVYT